MPNINYKPGSVRSVLETTETLTELHFAIQSALDWFLGRGVYRVGLERSRPLDGSCVLMATAMITPGPCRVSNTCLIGEAVKQNIIPLDIPKKEHFKGLTDQPDIKYGQHYFSPANKAEAVLINRDLYPNVPIGHITFAAAGMIAGFIAKGSRSARFQLSQKHQELAIKHNLSEHQLAHYLNSNESGEELFEYDWQISSLS